MTGKLFEYLAADRPILLLGTGNAAADIVTRAGAGWTIPVGDVNAALLVQLETVRQLTGAEVSREELR